MVEKLSQIQNLYYIFPEEDEEVELEEGFVELEDDTDEDEDTEGIEWLWEEEIQVDGPIGPIIIKKGKYTTETF
ncbi:hypothetical protein IH575_00085 [Candidatus Dojkabacteria bacterium]|nr:hypothetical protein [Candidatus Dojkabacteria bacterium]